MIGQTEWLVNPWLFVISLLCLITLVGVAWAIVRERHLVDLSRDQNQSMRDVERTFQAGTEAVRAGFSNLERQIERFEDISENKRQEIVRLIVDVERRMIEAMRDISRAQQGMNVHFNRDAQGTQIGDGNKQS